MYVFLPNTSYNEQILSIIETTALSLKRGKIGVRGNICLTMTSTSISVRSKSPSALQNAVYGCENPCDRFSASCHANRRENNHEVSPRGRARTDGTPPSVMYRRAIGEIRDRDAVFQTSRVAVLNEALFDREPRTHAYRRNELHELCVSRAEFRILLLFHLGCRISSLVFTIVYS